MKAFVLKSRGNVGWIEKPEPRLTEAHGALLKPVLVSPCTSDVHTVWQGSPKRPNLTLGHECLAEIAAVGSEVQDFHAGELVAVSAITPDWDQPDVEENYAHAGGNFSAHMLGKSIDGAFQPLFYLPHADKNLAHIPAGMPLEDALMCVDVVQTGFTAVEEADVRPGQTVVVMGIGAIGLAAILGCRLRGASRVFAIGSSHPNTELAEELSGDGTRVEVLNYRTCEAVLPAALHPLANATGAPVVNEVLARTDCRGADRVLICGGSDLSLPQAVDMVRYGTGIVSNVMYFGADPDLQEAQAQHLRGRMAAEAGKPGGADTDASAGHVEEKTLAYGNTAAALGEARPIIDGLLLPKFSMGRGMAGKTLKFSLSRGGRKNLERVLREVQESGLHPGRFITKQYRGMEKIEDALYDMKERRAIKIAVHC